MMAAGRAAEKGASVLLLEKTAKPGQKLLLTGNGRCNISNTAPLHEFISMYGANGPFLYGSFKHFFRDELVAFLKSRGVLTSAEEDGRIFPSSGKAEDVLGALRSYLAAEGIKIAFNTPVTGIRIAGGKVEGVETSAGLIPAGAVILATGGSSYSKTGSSGDGFRLALKAGHTIVPLRPALVPLAVKEKVLSKSMQGVSLHNARITAFNCKAEDVDPARVPSADTGRGTDGKAPRPPIIESRTGDLIFAHFGISGPCVLKMSLAIIDTLARGPVSVSIDLMPQQTETQIRVELANSMALHGKKTLVNLTGNLIPPKLAQSIIGIAGILPEKQCRLVTAAERDRLAGLMKSLRFNILSPLSFDAAMVTAGGISLKEINPRTMSSLLVKGLYFCGEVMDLDAETGGFNLQAAFSTGYVSGESAATYLATL